MQAKVSVGFFMLIVIVIPVLLAILTPIYRRYLDISVGKALLLAAVGILAYIVLAGMLFPMIQTVKNLQNLSILFPILFHVAIPPMVFFFLFPFLYMLYSKWIANRVTEQERIPGLDGVRAWLSAGNLICCLGIAIYVRYINQDWSAFFITMLTLLIILMLYPFTNMISSLVTNKTTGREDLTSAREKILQLLENGKINTQECAELLSALQSRKASEEERIESTK